MSSYRATAVAPVHSENAESLKSTQNAVSSLPSRAALCATSDESTPPDMNRSDLDWRSEVLASPRHGERARLDADGVETHHRFARDVA